MNNLYIRQKGNKCSLWDGDVKIAEGGRVAIKKLATETRNSTGKKLFNFKSDGSMCEVLK